MNMRFNGLRSNASRQRGFTLVELLIAIAMFSLFTLTLTQLLMGGIDAFKRGQVITTLKSDVKSCLTQIESDLRFANSRSSFTDPVYTSGNQSLSASFYRFPARDIDWTVDGSTSTYKVDYTIDKEGDTYVLNYAKKSGTKYKMIDNVMLSTVPGQAGTSGNYNSYFQWGRVSYGSNINTVPEDVMNVRLTSGRYLGKEILTMTMSSAVAVRTPVSCSNMKASGGIRTQSVELLPFEVNLRAGSVSF
ncbi:MAG: type II secretion system protein J [Candidatus Bruticola sp.]